MSKINIERYYIWIGPVAVFFLWVIINSTNIASTTLLPSVTTTLSKLYEIIVTGAVFPNLGSTILRAFAGFSMSVILGVPIGVYLGANPKVYKMFEFVIEFFRSIPGTAMFPLFLLVFGIGDGSKIAIAWFMSFWIVLVNSVYGVLQSSRTRARVAQSLKATHWQTLFRVVFMDALPQIFIGLKIGLSLSLIAVVVSEMFIGSNSGLGQKIYDSYLTYEIPSLYAWLIVTGLSGYVLNKLFTLFEYRVIHWVGK